MATENLFYGLPWACKQSIINEEQSGYQKKEEVEGDRGRRNELEREREKEREGEREAASTSLGA